MAPAGVLVFTSHRLLNDFYSGVMTVTNSLSPPGAGHERDDSAAGPVIGRRTLLARAAATAVLAALGVAVTQGKSYAAGPQPSLVGDSFKGLLAFLVPGPDAFSEQQGQTSPSPGGVDAGTGPYLESIYDHALAVPVIGRLFNLDLPGGAAVAAIIDVTAIDVNPAAAVGPMNAPFARLTFAQKAQVFQQLEAPGLADGTLARFIIDTLPTLTAFMAYSEAAVFDPNTRQLTGVPTGWKISGYQGVSDGWDEFKGYYGGVSHVTG
jgi:hypothetical protein